MEGRFEGLFLKKAVKSLFYPQPTDNSRASPVGSSQGVWGLRSGGADTKMPF